MLLDNNFILKNLKFENNKGASAGGGLSNLVL